MLTDSFYLYHQGAIKYFRFHICEAVLLSISIRFSVASYGEHQQEKGLLNLFKAKKMSLSKSLKQKADAEKLSIKQERMSIYCNGLCRLLMLDSCDVFFCEMCYCELWDLRSYSECITGVMDSSVVNVCGFCGDGVHWQDGSKLCSRWGARLRGVLMCVLSLHKVFKRLSMSNRELSLLLLTFVMVHSNLCTVYNKPQHQPSWGLKVSFVGCFSLYS